MPREPNNPEPDRREEEPLDVELDRLAAKERGIDPATLATITPPLGKTLGLDSPE